MFVLQPFRLVIPVSFHMRPKIKQLQDKAAGRVKTKLRSWTIVSFNVEKPIIYLFLEI